MKKLKIVLLFSILVFIYVFYITHNNIYKSKYHNENVIEGYINNIKKYDTKTQIELIGKEKILVNYKEDITAEIGDYIKVYGTLNIPSNNTNFNLFNYNKYLKSKKIYYIFKADKIIKIKNNNKLRYKIKRLVIKRLNRINNKYLYTFILGDSNYLDESIKLSFRNNGISHLFAVSGMHITLLSMIILKLLNKLLKNKHIINLMLFSFLFFYMFLTNFTPSVIRATFLFISLSINKIFKLKLNPLICILLILDCMLIFNPYYIYNIGFILSFLVSISLILFGKISNNYHNYFVKILMTSIISFLISIPVVINNNNEINLLTPLINVLFVPLISLIIFPLSLITFICPIFNPILNILINIFESLSLLVDKIDIFMIILKNINIFIFIFYYCFILFVIKKLLIKKYSYLLLILITLIIHNNINYFNRNVTITMLDVGQGDSILLEIKNQNVLIDTGGNYHYDLSSNIIIPYLKSRGIKKIDYLILTHGDFDHMGEAVNLVNNYKVEKVIFNCGSYNDEELKLIKNNVKYDKCIKILKIDKYKLEFLNRFDYGNENDNSNVIYTELDGYKFMFMGDASIKTEHDILKKYNLSNIDVLKVGHHGSKTSTSIEFINTIKPKYSLISVGLNNKFNHPNKEALDNLKESKIYRTDQDGSIMFKIKNNKLKIETCSP